MHLATHNTVAIIGGGVSGALTAWQLVTQSDATRTALRVVIVDPRPQLGLGLAFSTPSMRHLLNVPTAKISALPHDPDHFLRWVRTNYDATAQPFSFMPRAIFGRYMRSIYAEVESRVEHLQASAIDLHKTPDGIAIVLSDGHRLHAAYAVLATGNFDPPMLPNIAPQAIEDGLYSNNAWAATTFDNLAPDAPVALIGTGLTAVDVLLRLRELGHRAAVTCISRHGAFCSRHVETPAALAPVIDRTTPRTALAYLRAIRAAVRNGMPWRAAIDSLRLTTNDLWLALPHREQRRVRRHLLHRWEVLRHRMAPAISYIVDAERDAGTLIVREGSFAGIDIDSGLASVRIKTHHGIEFVRAARVINCTGPSASYRNVPSPLIKSLFAQGVATAGPHGGAFNTTASGAMIDAHGAASSTLFNLGPGRLGNLIESIAVPEIRQQAHDIAAHITTRIAHLKQPARAAASSRHLPQQEQQLAAV